MGLHAPFCQNLRISRTSIIWAFTRHVACYSSNGTVNSSSNNNRDNVYSAFIIASHYKS